MFKSPFLPSASKPGHGSVHIGLLPGGHAVLKSFTYQYPLKLISPAPYVVQASANNNADTDAGADAVAAADQSVILVFLLTYGGGLVSGDQIHLSLTLEPSTRLALVTQGSTKLFGSPSKNRVSRQFLDVDIAPAAALCYLPDPTQPFDGSAYEQRQTFRVAADASLAVLDWVSEGRRARGERWGLRVWKGRNEVRRAADGKLLLRDALLLDDGHGDGDGKTSDRPRDIGGRTKTQTDLEAKTDGLGILGTLILYGPLFQSLGQYFLREFEKLPRIGGRNWDATTTTTTTTTTSLSPSPEHIRLARQHQEKADGLLWTAASIRGFVLVKFGALEVEGARRWLASMLGGEGSVTAHFGEKALLGLR